MPTDALAEIAQELYALDPSEFTPARNARAAEVRADDRALADDIRLLRKPSIGAWLVNQVVRLRREPLDAALALGADLRAAQAAQDAAELAPLMRRRRADLAELGRTTVGLAEELGHPVGTAVVDEVVQTIAAGMADAWAASAILSGRLVRTLAVVGFDPVDLDGAVAGGPVTQPLEAAGHPTSTRTASEPDATPPVPDARARAAAERAADAAEQRAQAAAERVRSHDDELEKLQAELSEVRAERDARREELRVLDASLATLEESERAETKARRRAAEEAERAARQAADARAALDGS